MRPAHGTSLLLVLPLIGLAASWGAPRAADATPPATRSSCAGGKTVSSSAGARVYKQAGSYFGCAFAVGKRVRLNSGTATYDYIWRNLKGTMFAFALRHFGLAPQEVVVRDLYTGKVVHRHAANQARDEGDMVFAVQKLLVSPTGAAVWLACSTIATTDSFCKGYELHAVDRENRHRLLDQGDPRAFSAVIISSRRGTVSWKHAGAPRSAPLH